MNTYINPEWNRLLHTEFEKDYFLDLTKFIHHEYTHARVYPEASNIFNAFKLCSWSDLKVAIIGQDPYHGEHKGVCQAQGLSFSIPSEMPLTPSLQNIFIELHNDLHRSIRHNGDLSDWAQQGVLLLNSVLTVQAHSPNSHQYKGWETFTDNVIKMIADKKEHVVFILWGNNAKKKEKLISRSKHCIISSPHPSPLSAYRGFFGSKPFSTTNKYLCAHNTPQITWI